jgi:hypothetical protein
MSDRLMYDSTNMDAIPLDAQIVAGYPHAFPTDYARFPHALQVKIDQHGNHADDCHVVDVEAGTVTIATARQWVASWHVLHPHGLAAVNGFFDQPTVYIQESNLAALRQALVGEVYDVWVAWWDRGTSPVSGTSLLQYASPTSNPPSGGDYDVSVVYDATWGVAFAPPPPPTWQATALAMAKKTEADAAAVVTYLEAHQ